MTLNRRDVLQTILIGLGVAGRGGEGKALSLLTGGQAPAAGAEAVALVSRVGAGTFALSNIDAQLTEYPKWLGYKVHWQGKISKELAEAWDAPKVAGRRAAVFGPADCDYGLL